MSLTDGTDATRRAIGPAYYHPHAVRRCAPAIKRLQRSVIHASKLARPPAADPRGRSAVAQNRMTNKDAHNWEIQANIANWKRKPVLREIYRAFHEEIANQLADRSAGLVVELGSGVADITEVIPNCVRTDLFLNPWIDQVQNAYSLSFEKQSVSNLILFDVFHHLRYPGTALNEFRRVLIPGGRVIIFEPCISVLGFIVFGLLHKEPMALGEQIHWNAPDDRMIGGRATITF